MPPKRKLHPGFDPDSDYSMRVVANYYARNAARTLDPPSSPSEPARHIPGEWRPDFDTAESSDEPPNDAHPSWLINLFDLAFSPVWNRICAVAIVRQDGAHKRRLVIQGSPSRPLVQRDERGEIVGQAAARIRANRNNNGPANNRSNVRLSSPERMLPGAWPDSPGVYSEHAPTGARPSAYNKDAAGSDGIAMEDAIKISDLSPPPFTSTPRQPVGIVSLSPARILSNALATSNDQMRSAAQGCRNSGTRITQPCNALLCATKPRDINTGSLRPTISSARPVSALNFHNVSQQNGVRSPASNHGPNERPVASQNILALPQRSNMTAVSAVELTHKAAPNIHHSQLIVDRSSTSTSHSIRKTALGAHQPNLLPIQSVTAISAQGRSKISAVIMAHKARAPRNKLLLSVYSPPNHTKGDTSSRFFERHDTLSRVEKDKIALKNHKDEVLDTARAQSEQWMSDYKSRTKFRHNKSPQTDPQTATREVSDDLFRYENDLSYLPDVPCSTEKHSNFDSHRKTRSFFDRGMNFAMDSTMENANLDPTAQLLKPISPVPAIHLQRSPFQNQTLKTPENTSPVAFLGVPLDTFAPDDSFDETAFSSELLNEVHADFKSKLTISPSEKEGKSAELFSVAAKHPVKTSIVILDSDSDEEDIKAKAKPSTTTKKVSQQAAAPTVIVPASSPAGAVNPLITVLNQSELDTLMMKVKETEHGRRNIPVGSFFTKDFGTLLPTLFNGRDNAWLNDEIINGYLKVLIKHEQDKVGWKKLRGKDATAPPVHAFPSFWFTQMDIGYNKVEKWATRQNLGGEKFLDSNLVLFPICDGYHWRLLAVKPKDRVIEYFDSLDKKSNVSGKYISLVWDYLQKELGALFVPSEWNIMKKQRSCMQMNGSDCGVFTILNSLVLLRGEDPNRVIVSDGMEDARRRIAVTLICNKPTGEMD